MIINGRSHTAEIHNEILIQGYGQIGGGKVESRFRHQPNRLTARINVHTRVRNRIFERHLELQIVDKELLQRRSDSIGTRRSDG